jgi:hypothetical protein
MEAQYAYAFDKNTRLMMRDYPKVPRVSYVFSPLSVAPTDLR